MTGSDNTSSKVLLISVLEQLQSNSSSLCFFTLENKSTTLLISNAVLFLCCLSHRVPAGEPEA